VNYTGNFEGSVLRFKQHDLHKKKVIFTVPSLSHKRATASKRGLTFRICRHVHIRAPCRDEDEGNRCFKDSERADKNKICH
jgi:hypothetical protein